MSDPAKYRTREEVQKMREEHDPIEQVKRRLSSDHGVSDDDIKAVDNPQDRHRGRRLCAERSGPMCPELWTDVYVEGEG
jgi:pyruvate dehydrogenase E1 component alpha subunit